VGSVLSITFEIYRKFVIDIEIHSPVVEVTVVVGCLVDVDSVVGNVKPGLTSGCENGTPVSSVSVVSAVPTTTVVVVGVVSEVAPGTSAQMKNFSAAAPS
jgi:hypothetical protein